ncbi:unnamed protein product [Linum tenue]|nr:unnamed protein product [Linum tenue]
MREDVAEDSPVDEEDPRCPTICFTKGELRSYRREWRSAIVVKALGRSFPYPVIARRLNMLWAKNGPIQVTNRANRFLFVRFAHKIDYEHALTGGPWMLGDHYLTTQKWKKGFNPRTCTVSSTLVWVRLPDLPIELFNPQAVLRIVSKAGTPVRVDRATELGARGLFARACIEVDLTKPLLSKYNVEGVEYELQYEGLSNVCFECGSYGHQKSHCPTLHSEEPDTPQPRTEATHVAPHHAENYGEWMIAKRRERRPYQKQNFGYSDERFTRKHDSGRAQPTGSRFAVLGDDEGAEVPSKGGERTTARKDNMMAPLERGGNDTATGKTRHPQRVWVEKRGSYAGESNAETGTPMEGPITKEQVEKSNVRSQTSLRAGKGTFEGGNVTMDMDLQPIPNVKEGASANPLLVQVQETQMNLTRGEVIEEHGDNPLQQGDSTRTTLLDPSTNSMQPMHTKDMIDAVNKLASGNSGQAKLPMGSPPGASSSTN